MSHIQPIAKLMIIAMVAASALYGAGPAAATFESYLQENKSARARYENCSADQQQKMEQRWIIFNEQYNSLSLEEQEKIDIMRREREERWNRLSGLERAQVVESLELDPETCIALYPYQECNI